MTAYKEGCTTMVQILGVPKGTIAHAFGAHDDSYLVRADQLPN